MNRSVISSPAFCYWKAGYRFTLCVVLSLSFCLGLISCGGGVTSLSGRIEKSIVPKARVPGSTTEGTLLQYGADLLYLNKQWDEDSLTFTRYNDTLGTIWEKRIAVSSKKERFDWNPIYTKDGKLYIGSTQVPEVSSEEYGPQDSSYYRVRCFSLSDGSLISTNLLYTLSDYNETTSPIKMDYINETYGREGNRASLQIQLAPDSNSFLIGHYDILAKERLLRLYCSYYKSDLTLLKQGTKDIPIDAEKETVIGAQPCNDGTILLLTFHGEQRKLRAIRYNLTTDEKTSELSYTFAPLEGYDVYTFKSMHPLGSRHAFYTVATVIDPPASLFGSSRSDLGCIYLGSIDFDKNAITLTKSIPDAEAGDSTTSTSELQDAGVKACYIDETNGRIIVVLEESVTTMSSFHMAIQTSNPIAGSRESGLARNGGLNSITSPGSFTSYRSSLPVIWTGDKYILGFDMQHRLQWKHQIPQLMSKNDDLLGGVASSYQNKKLSVWYPDGDIIWFYSYDPVNGTILTADDKAAVVKCSGSMYYSVPFARYNPSNHLYFLVKNGRFSEDSFLYKLRLP